ncbi:MAG: VPLPA-CTERM sorting domain-containing protein [Pseudomonadota bacterium]
MLQRLFTALFVVFFASASQANTYTYTYSGPDLECTFGCVGTLPGYEATIVLDEALLGGSFAGGSVTIAAGGGVTFFSLNGAAFATVPWQLDLSWTAGSTSGGFHSGSGSSSMALTFDAARNITSASVDISSVDGQFLFGRAQPDVYNLNGAVTANAATAGGTWALDTGLAPVPVPASALILLTGLGALTGAKRLRKTPR